jgi:hypothetical protein
MTNSTLQTAQVSIRPFQYRDVDELERMIQAALEEQSETRQSEILTASLEDQLQQVRYWYGALKGLSLFPNPLQHFFCVYVAELGNKLCGMVKVSPFNSTRSTWKIDCVLSDRQTSHSSLEIGTQLLRHCFQNIWEARTWLIETNIHDKDTLALYRHNGFQQLARMTYWAIAPGKLQLLAEREPDIPNLLPISNADAALMHQLDTTSMPPLVRQVFDRHVIDFKSNPLEKTGKAFQRMRQQERLVSGYVYESQRKVAIGCFRVNLNCDGKQPHSADLTINPAYTWLYPELFAQIARVVQDYPGQDLHLASADYQPEREEYLEAIGAERVEHTLMMSRSVWHKVRESRFSFDSLQLTEVLQGLQPNRKPVPGRFYPIPPLNPQDIQPLKLDKKSDKKLEPSGDEEIA